MIFAEDLSVGNIFRSAFGKAETVLSIIDNTNNGQLRVLTKEEQADPTNFGFQSEHHRDMYSHLILCKENGNQYKPCEIEGEPLTEFWIGKLGGTILNEGEFYKDYIIGSAGLTMKVRYKKDIKKFIISVWCGEQHDDDDCRIIWIDFVHELQNVYRRTMKGGRLKLQ